MDSTVWRSTMGKFATGVTIITTIDTEGNPMGMTANAFTSLSLDPPLVLICIDNKSGTLTQLLASKKYCVNLLASSQENLSRIFARRGGAEKFENVPYSAGVTGVPVLDGCLASVECMVTNVVEGGDHLILVGEGIQIHEVGDATEPLIFYKGKYEKLNKDVV
ncbi:MAG: flavin reductase family protein [Candidatus Pristimantibacillus sp.]